MTYRLRNDFSFDRYLDEQASSMRMERVKHALRLDALYRNVRFLSLDKIAASIIEEEMHLSHGWAEPVYNDWKSVMLGLFFAEIVSVLIIGITFVISYLR